MHEKEILQNLARSGRLASQTHRRALTHSLLNKALHCSLIQDSNVSSNSDCQPPADASTARYDRFRQQSHFCCNCESRDGMSKFQNRDEHPAIKRDLPEKLHHRCSHCQHPDDLPDVGSKTGQGGRHDHQLQPVIQKLCQRCLVADAGHQYFQRGGDLEDAASDDECQECVKRATSLPHERTPGTGYLRQTSDCHCDGSNGSPHCETQQGRQSGLSEAFQPIREVNMNMKVSSGDKPCSCGEKGVVSLRRQLNNEWYQRNSESQGYQDSSVCQQSRKCSCSQHIQQHETPQRGQIQEHKRNYQRIISGNDGELRHSSFNVEMNRKAELWSATTDHKYMGSSQSQVYKGSNEDQLYKKPEDRLYKRSVEDQKYKKPEDQLYKRSVEDQKYKKTEDQLYKRSVEDQKYKKPEDQLYKRSVEDQKYKKPEDQLYKRSVEDQKYKKPEDPLYKRSVEDQKYKKPEDQLYKRSVEDPQYDKSEDQMYKRSEDSQYNKSEDQMYKRSEDSQYNKSEDQMYKRFEDPQYNDPEDQMYKKTNDDQHKKGMNDPLNKKTNGDSQYKRTEGQPYTKSVEDRVYRKQNNDLLNEKISDGQQYKRIDDRTNTSDELQPQSTGSSQHYRKAADDIPQLPKDDQQSKRSSDEPQDEQISQVQQSQSSLDDQFKKIQELLHENMADGHQHTRASLFQKYLSPIVEESIERTHDGHQNRSSSGGKNTRTTDVQEFGGNTFERQFERTSDDLFGRVSQDQRSARTSDDLFGRVSQDQRSARTSDNQKPEKVCCDQQYMRTSDNQQFERTSHKQQCVRTSDYPYMRTKDNEQFIRSCDDHQLKSSDNLYVRPSENQRRTSEDQEITRTRDVWQCENNTADQHLESGEEYQTHAISRQCKTCTDNQQSTSGSRKQQCASDYGNHTSCNTCKCKKTLDGQTSSRQVSGVLIERHAQWSKMEDAEQQEKQNFDAAMKQMSLYMNGISQVCECFYDSCSKDNLSLLERRHIRMFHKGVLPVRQPPKKKSDTTSHEDNSSCPPHCPCLASVNRLQRGDQPLSEERSQRHSRVDQPLSEERSQRHSRVDQPLSEERSQRHSRIPSTDRSQNFMGFSDAGPCLDPDVEDDSQMEDVFHRADKSQSARSQTTGKSQFCVRFSDTDAEINQSNKNVHCSEMSETCISPLTSESLLRDFYSSIPLHEDRKQIYSTESATDNTLNSQSAETVLANCTPSFDSSQAGSLKHQTRVHKSGHKMATTTRYSRLSQQRQRAISGAHPPQDVFIEGVSAFPTKASKILSKCSKGKVRSSRSNLEQGILIRTQPGSYIVRKPKEDSSIHLLQVNPGNYVKLNM